MLSNEEGFITLDFGRYVHLLVWLSKEFAVEFDPEEKPVGIEVHAFC